MAESVFDRMARQMMGPLGAQAEVISRFEKMMEVPSSPLDKFKIDIDALTKDIKPIGYYAAETLRDEIEAFNAQIPEGKVGVAVIVSNVGLLECREIDYNGMYLIFHGRNVDGDSVRHISTPGATSVTLTAVAESAPSEDRGIGFLWSADRE